MTNDATFVIINYVVRYFRKHICFANEVKEEIMATNRNNSDFEKEYYQKLMAEHLPELRKTLGISQSELADYIGSTRQSINSIENKKRPMMWDTFMSLMLLFISNNDTKIQLNELQIDTKKISNFLKIKKKRVKK